MQDQIRYSFNLTQGLINRACRPLESLIETYAKSDLDAVTKRARIAALNAKIDYLKGLKFDPQAHPWMEDGPVDSKT